MGKTRQLQSDSVRWQLLVCLLAVICGTSLIVAGSGPASQPSRLHAFIEPAADLSRPPQIVPPQVLGARTPAHHVAKQLPKRSLAAEAPLPDCSQLKCLALTFDDGPNPLTTPQIVDELHQANVQATFFMVGSRVPGNEALLRQMYADGDEIEDHSWTHPDFTTLTPDQIHQQISLTQQAIENAGVPAPTMFRPPYGAVNATVEANVPLTILLWDEDPRDWDSNTSAQIIQSVEASAQPGGIVDMHDIYHITANAVPQIITTLQGQGYHLVTVSQLLHLTPTNHGPIYGQH